MEPVSEDSRTLPMIWSAEDCRLELPKKHSNAFKHALAKTRSTYALSVSSHAMTIQKSCSEAGPSNFCVLKLPKVIVL